MNLVSNLFTITAYLKICCAKYSTPQHRITSITQFFCTALLPSFVYEKVRRWTSKIDFGPSIQLALVPIHLHSCAHWILGVIVPLQRTVYLLDSLSMGKPREARLLAAYMRREMEARHEDGRSWKIEIWNRPLPQQNNGFDCGVYVCEFARRIAAGEKVHDPIDPRAVRNRILKELTQPRSIK